MENVEQEFLSVIREYERVIYKVCYLYTTPNATLNDLYQEVVLNIWKAFPKFRRECKISTWIYRIALNTCISFIRKEKEHSGDCHPHPGSRLQRRGRRNASHVTATLPDDKPAGTVGEVYHPALSGRKKAMKIFPRLPD